MITVQLTNSSPYAYTSGVAEILEGTTIPSYKVQETNDICICDIPGLCEYTSLVFGEVADSTYWKNDKRSFLYQKLISSDTITINLYKNGVLLTTITDDTYGEYFSTLAPIQANYVYFILDFEKVASLSGYGTYQIKTDVSIIGISETLESEFFKLEPYSDIRANGTVRIETYQNGNIIGSPFDFTGLNIYQSHRIKGDLKVEESLEIENYQTQNYKLSQIQDQVVNEWTLNTKLLPSLITKDLIYNNLLANQLQVTDYNINNHEIYRRVELYPTEIPEAKSFGNNPNKKYIIKFTDKTPDNIKRNF